MLRLIHDINPDEGENESNEDSKAENSLKYSEWLRKLDEAMANFEN